MELNQLIDQRNINISITLAASATRIEVALWVSRETSSTMRTQTSSVTKISDNLK
jgi:hypothetical protein